MGRFVWGFFQLILVIAGILAVAVIVSRILPPAIEEPPRPTTTPSAQHSGSQPSSRQQRQPRQTAPEKRQETANLQMPGDVDTVASPPHAVHLAITSREVDRAKTDSKLVALTFDAGSSAEPVPQILRTLAQRNLRCTFFLTGKWIERYPEMARMIADAGHELGNHSWSHPAFPSLTEDQMREELRRTENIALQVCGVSTKPLFRPPFGARNERVRAIAAEEGYLTIYWTIDSWDSVKKDITPQMIADRVMRHMQPGAIVLMHCGSHATAQALPQLLNALEAQGYRVVTVSELLHHTNGE